jgi:hypothetical protein
MSAENVELVRRILPEDADLVEIIGSDDPVAALTGDPSFDIPDLEVEFAGSQSGAPALNYRGLEGLVEGWREWLLPWASYRLRVDDVIDAGDKVLQLVTVHARTSRDGVDIVHHPAAVWVIRGSVPVSVHFFLEQDLAREFAEVD